MDQLKKARLALGKKNFKNVQKFMSEAATKAQQQEKVKMEIVQNGGLEILKEFMKGPQVLVHFLSVFVMLSISSNVEVCKYLGTEDQEAVRCVLHMMITNKEPQLQTYAVGFFRNMSRINSIKQMLLDLGAFDALVELVKDADDDFFDDKVLQSALSNAVATIGSFASLYHTFSSADGIPDEQVQYAEELVTEMGVEKGANHALYSLLKKIGSAKEVMPEMPQFTFQALQFLSLVTANAKQLHSMGIVQAVEELLSKPRFSENYNVQKQGSTLIQVITMNEDLVEDMSKGDSNGQDELAKYLKDFQTGDPAKQSFALGYMWNLANVQSNLAIMRERGVLEVAAEALQKAKYTEYMVNASGLLAALAFDFHNATLLGLKGVIPVLTGLFSAIKSAPSSTGNDSILENVLACFGCLSLVQNNREEMGLYNLLKKFVTMLQEPDLKPQFKSTLIKIMISLAHEERHKMLDNGAVDTLVDLLNDESSSKKLRSDICAVLWNLQNDDTIQSYLHEKDVFNSMVALLSETDLNKTSDLLNQNMAGMDEDELMQKVGKEVKDFDMKKYEEEMRNMRKLDDEMNIDDSDDEMDDDDYDGEDDEFDMSLAPEEDDDDDDELQPEEDDGAELQPEEDDDELKPSDDLQPEADLELEAEHDEALDDDDEPELQPAEDIESKDQELEAKKLKREESALVMKKKREEFLKRREEKKKEREAKKQQSQEDTDKLQKRLQKRCRIALELLETELAYVDSLGKVKELFMQPLLVEYPNMINKNDFKMIFSDIQLICMINQSFLDELKQLFDKDNKPKNPENIELDVGSLLLRRAPTFKLYTTFVNSYDDAESTLQKCIKGNRKFSEFLERISMQLFESGHRQTDLGSFLIMPIQRLPRYSLLLSDLLKHSDSEGKSGYSMLKNAIVQIQKITGYVNDAKRDVENKHMVKELARRLGIRGLANDKRTLKKVIRDLTYTTYEKHRPTASRSKNFKSKTYVCNDMIIVARKGASKKIGKKVYYTFPLKNTTIDKKMADKDRQGTGLTLETTMPDNPKNKDLVMELNCPNRTTRDELFTEIRDIISSLS